MTMGEFSCLYTFRDIFVKTRYFQAYFCNRLVLQITFVFAHFKRISLFIFRRCNCLKKTNPNKICKTKSFIEI